MTLRLTEIAARLALEMSGEDVEVHRPSLIQDASPGTICLATNRRYADDAASRGCAALVAPPGLETTLPCLLAPKPRVAFAKLLALFDDRPIPPAGVHPDATVADTADIDPTASIGARAVVEPGAVIGPGTRVGAGAYIGHASTVGRDCVLAPGAVVLHRCTLGDRVRLHAGAVVGSDGFGYEWDGREHVPVPHIGTVVIEDDVEIGANSCVDRAKTGETRVGRGTKVDNLVQIAHNVTVGPNCLMAAQVGIAGSASLGAGVVMAGQSGMVDGCHLGDGAVVAAKSGVLGDMPGGATYMGMPAREVGEMRRILAALPRLPSILARLRALERDREPQPDEEA